MKTGRLKKSFDFNALALNFLSHFQHKLGRRFFVGPKRKLLSLIASPCANFPSPFLPNQTMENTYFLSTFLFALLFLPLFSSNKHTLIENRAK